MAIRRLKLETCVNMRDIGGYVGNDMRTTQFGEFLRSDDVSLCKDYEVEYLVKFGVKTVIDLRGKDELKIFPNRFSATEGISYYNIPLVPKKNLIDLKECASLQLDEMYIEIIESADIICKLFKTIAASCDGTVVYHCTAGKDRTGVVTCLLLMLAAVDKYDIAADYQITYTYLETRRVLFEKEFPDMPQHVLKSEPEWIIRLYEYVETKYGTADDYLKNIGLTEDEIKKIKKKLIGE